MDNERKTQLKMDYKMTIQPKGVYQIRNTVNNRVFVGSAANLEGKFNSHKFQLNFGSHRNSELQREWKEFGPEQFVFEVLEKLKIKDNILQDYSDELKDLEEKWLEKLQPYGDKGYNEMAKNS